MLCWGEVHSFIDLTLFYVLLNMIWKARFQNVSKFSFNALVITAKHKLTFQLQYGFFEFLFLL